MSRILAPLASRVRATAFAALLGVGAAVLGSVAWDAATHGVEPAQSVAHAVATGQVIGTWQLKLTGDAWVRSGEYRSEKLRIEGLLVLRNHPSDTNTGLVDVEVMLDIPKDGVLAPALSNPVFQGTARIVGDSMAVIATGVPNYVNALNVQFDPTGRKLAGMWMNVFPSSETSPQADGFATGVSFTLKGRQLRRPTSRTDAAADAAADAAGGLAPR